MSRRGLGLVVSEQLMPHALCALHYLGQVEPLAKIVLIHTVDAASERPVLRLERFLAPHAGGVPIERRATGVYAADTERTVQALAADPAVDHWVLNVSGGTKLMGFGFFRAIGLPDRFTVVYREFTLKRWFRVVYARGTGTIATHDCDIEDRLPAKVTVDDAVRLQLELLDGEDVSSEPLPEAMPSLESALATCQREGVDLAWAYARELGWPKPPSGGFGLEMLAADALRRMGFAPRHSLKRTELNQKSRQEVDVLYLANDGLRIVDCKLLNEESAKPTAQLHEAYSTARRFIGLGKGYVMLRPNLPLDPKYGEIVRGLGIGFIGQDRARDPASALAEWAEVGPAAREEAARIDVAVRAALDAGALLYGQPSRHPDEAHVQRESGETFWDASPKAAALLGERPYLIVALPGGWLVSCKGASPVCEPLQALFGPPALSVAAKTQARTWLVPAHAPYPDLPTLRQAIRDAVGPL